MIGKTTCWYDEGGDMSLSPHTVPVLSDHDVVPVRSLSHRGSHKSAGVEPLVSV